MAKNGTSREQKQRKSCSQAEHAARAVFERYYRRQLGDEEWAKLRGRLLEFVLTLARWDSEQLRTPQHAKMDSEPAFTGLAWENKGECRETDQLGV